LSCLVEQNNISDIELLLFHLLQYTTMAEASLYTQAEQEEKIVRLIIENNKHARYAAIWDLDGKVLSEKHAKGEKNILTLEETQGTIKRSLERWKERDELRDKIGKGEYSVVSYEKIKRISIPLEGGRILFVSVDGGQNVEIKYIMELVDYTLNKVVAMFPIPDKE